MFVQSIDAIARPEQIPAQTKHSSSYMSHVFVHVHVQNEGLARKESAVGMALSDGLLGFELGKNFDGEVERYLRMIGTQLNC